MVHRLSSTGMLRPLAFAAVLGLLAPLGCAADTDDGRAGRNANVDYVGVRGGGRGVPAVPGEGPFTRSGRRGGEQEQRQLTSVEIVGLLDLIREREGDQGRLGGERGQTPSVLRFANDRVMFLSENLLGYLDQLRGLGLERRDSDEGRELDEQSRSWQTETEMADDARFDEVFVDVQRKMLYAMLEVMDMQLIPSARSLMDNEVMLHVLIEIRADIQLVFDDAEVLYGLLCGEAGPGKGGQASGNGHIDMGGSVSGNLSGHLSGSGSGSGGQVTDADCPDDGQVIDPGLGAQSDDGEGMIQSDCEMLADPGDDTHDEIPE